MKLLKIYIFSIVLSLTFSFSYASELDPWVKKLVIRRFTPSLVTNYGDDGMAPEPVSIITKNSQSYKTSAPSTIHPSNIPNPEPEGMWVTLYSAADKVYIGTFPLWRVLVNWGDDYRRLPYYISNYSSINSHVSGDHSQYFGTACLTDEAGALIGCGYHLNLMAGGSDDIQSLMFHLDWTGPDCNEDDCWWNDYEQEIDLNRYQDAVYARLFHYSGSQWIIQYWFYYPFNDAANCHEGDWEHINVNITWSDTDDPWVCNTI